MRVHIPTPLRSYTAQMAWVEASGATLDELLHDLDRRFTGLRFRIVDEQGRLRRHVRVYVGTEMTRDLAAKLSPDDQITIMQALSGG
jgi:molybdopterin synthase sulfur carrier subunit